MNKLGIAIASITTAVLMTATAAPSMAATQNETNAARYAAMDLNHDGVVSVHEFGIAAQKFLDSQKATGFAAIDVNHDGDISPTELFHPAHLVTNDSAKPSVNKASYTTTEATGSRDVSKLRPVIEVYEYIDTAGK